MKKLEKHKSPISTFLINIGYMVIGAAIFLGGYYVIRSSVQPEQQVAPQQTQEQPAQEAAAKEEEQKQKVEYLECQIAAEKTFLAARDQIPAGYSTSQHIQMLQTLEQKRSTDLDNCDRRKN